MTKCTLLLAAVSCVDSVQGISRHQYDEKASTFNERIVELEDEMPSLLRGGTSFVETGKGFDSGFFNSGDTVDLEEDDINLDNPVPEGIFTGTNEDSDTIFMKNIREQTSTGTSQEVTSASEATGRTQEDVFINLNSSSSSNPPREYSYSSKRSGQPEINEATGKIIPKDILHDDDTRSIEESPRELQKIVDAKLKGVNDIKDETSRRKNQDLVLDEKKRGIEQMVRQRIREWEKRERERKEREKQRAANFAKGKTGTATIPNVRVSITSSRLPGSSQISASSTRENSRTSSTRSSTRKSRKDKSKKREKSTLAYMNPFDLENWYLLFNYLIYIVLLAFGAVVVIYSSWKYVKSKRNQQNQVGNLHSGGAIVDGRNAADGLTLQPSGPSAQPSRLWQFVSTFNSRARNVHANWFGEDRGNNSDFDEGGLSLSEKIASELVEPSSQPSSYRHDRATPLAQLVDSHLFMQNEDEYISSIQRQRPHSGGLEMNAKEEYKAERNGSFHDHNVSHHAGNASYHSRQKFNINHGAMSVHIDGRYSGHARYSSGCDLPHENYRKELMYQSGNSPSQYPTLQQYIQIEDKVIATGENEFRQPFHQKMIRPETFNESISITRNNIKKGNSPKKVPTDFNESYDLRGIDWDS